MIKKYAYYLYLFFLLFIAKNISGQNFIIYGDKTFGGSNDDQFPLISNLGSNEFILTGTSHNNINGDKTDPLCDSSAVSTDADIWLLKIDTTNTIYWNKSIGGNKSEGIALSILTADKKIIFSCYTQSDSTCEKTEAGRGFFDYWICMVDSDGNKNWDKTLGGSNIDNYPNIIQLTSGDFIITGVSGSPISGDKTVSNYGANDFWTIKLDTNGNKKWDRVYGGTFFEYAGYFTASVPMVACPDGNFIISGSTNSPVSGDISDTSRGGQDIWIIKCDTAGNKIWDKRFGGSGVDAPCHIINTSDNGYILCGNTGSPNDGDVSDSSHGGLSDIWVIKLDSLGNKQWDKRYGGNNTDASLMIKQDGNNGYLIAGNTNSDSSNYVSEPGYGDGDYWIFKIDTAGNKIWDKRFGTSLLDIATSFIVMPDSSIYLFGYASTGISAVKSDSGKGGYDYWLVHFKYIDNTTGINENDNQNNLISIYPNPTKGKSILNSNAKEKADIFINDVMGKETYCKKNVLLNHYEIDISSFSNGVYFLKVKSAEKYFLKKIVKM